MNNIDYVGLELNVGSLCNFRCRYCFEGTIEYNPTKVSMEYLNRYSEYIHYIKKEFYKDKKFIMRIYGGEPLLQYDAIEYFIFKIQDVVESISIISNGFLVKDLQNKLLKLKNLCKNVSLNFAISYDFINQDSMRQKDSSEIILNSIRWLYKNNFNVSILTVFTESNIYTFTELFFDFIKFKKELPDLTCSFAIDRSKKIQNINFIKLRKELARVKSYIIRNNLNYCFQHRGSFGITRANSIFDKCFHGDIFVAMNYDGNMYPGYDVPYESEFIKNIFYIGHITQDFKTLEENRLAIIEKRPTNIKNVCKKCKVLCRVYPWKVIKNDFSEWWNIPDGQHCELHKLIGEYF